jgi:hypothetical protein
MFKYLKMVFANAMAVGSQSFNESKFIRQALNTQKPLDQLAKLAKFS